MTTVITRNIEYKKEVLKSDLACRVFLSLTRDDRAGEIGDAFGEASLRSEKVGKESRLEGGCSVCVFACVCVCCGPGKLC